MKKVFSPNKKQTIHYGSREFKEKIIEYGNKRMGKTVTYKSFNEWLNRSGVYIIQGNWQVIFRSLLKNYFQVAIFYEVMQGELTTQFRVLDTNEIGVYV